MPSADQVPVKSPHSRMLWHKWGVLTAGSTGSALRAVRLPNLHITPDLGAISLRPERDRPDRKLLGSPTLRGGKPRADTWNTKALARLTGRVHLRPIIRQDDQLLM